MSSEPIISLRNVSKTYRAYNHPLHRLIARLSGGRTGHYKEFHALNDVSFDIHKGETLGIVGLNGSGKSTLLQIICGIRQPTSGSVIVKGRISALLELGSGFQQEYTGRENVFLQGAIIGLTRDKMEKRINDIAAFADIGEYIDQPVKTYSSGMYMRLAFAVAVHLEPDILIIDEVLAVGDVDFQEKCIELIFRLQSQGTSIIVVSHNPYHIERLCHRAAVLHRGGLSDLMPAKEILMKYHEMAQEELKPSPMVNETSREGSHEVYFEKILIQNADTSGTNTVLTTEPMRIVAEIFAKRPINDIRFRFELCSSSNDIVAVVATNGHSEAWQLDGKHRITFTLNSCQLTSGWYYLNAIAGGKYVRLDTWQRAIDFKVLLRDKKVQDLSLDQGIFVCQGNWEFS